MGRMLDTGRIWCQSIKIPLVSHRKAGKCNLTKCPGRRRHSFHKQLTGLCQEIRRMKKWEKEDPTTEFMEGRIQHKEQKRKWKPKQCRVCKTTTGLQMMLGGIP